MIVKGTIPVTAVSLETEGSDVEDVIRKFQAEHPTARIESIDGELVRGLCLACSKPVFRRSRGYGYDEKCRGYVCPACITQSS